jgi:hypothetical protein
MKQLKVGITADLRVSLFSNGINQNALYLAMMYSDMGHQVDVIGPTSIDGQAAKEISVLKIEGLNLRPIKDTLEEHYDLIITVGLMIEQTHYDRYKKVNPNFKFVAYKCGNELLTDMESILYGAHEKRSKIFNSLPAPAVPDAIWSIPQMENTNLDYYSYQLGTDNATVVPFIWDPIVTEKYKEAGNHKEWTQFKGKNVGVMEPNISMMKNLLVPIVILDKYLGRQNELDHIYLFSAKKLATNPRLIKILQESRNNIIKYVTAEDRQPTLRVLDKHVDAVVSWQIENNLNYLYFDIAWMGWPIIHNANLCQDVGYYYEGQDATTAAQHLEHIFENHSKEYRHRNRKAIKRFTRQNKNLVKQYKQLTEDVMQSKFKKYTYDWKTNSVS